LELGLRLAVDAQEDLAAAQLVSELLENGPRHLTALREGYERAIDVELLRGYHR
jgi:spore coat polysaccharide biosynthesis protein SpsF (cytidylyltransferase family)